MSSSFWKQVQDGRLLCQQECTERCHGDNEENGSYDEYIPVRMNFNDELPIASLPHATYCQGKSSPERLNLRGLGKSSPGYIREDNVVESSLTLGRPVETKNQFSLPWAGLNGNQKDNVVESSLTLGRPVETKKQFSLPWADLNGNQKESVVSEPLSPSGRTKRSLLPCSTGFAVQSRNLLDSASLPRPKFMSGIPTKAYLYKPTSTDPIDVEMHHALLALHPEFASVLALLRVESGKYEIDGRNVVIYWDSAGGLLVHEEEVGGHSIADMPLQAYISLVANVALHIQRPAASGVLTFVEFEGPKTSDPSVDGKDRYSAMRIACTQAKLREQETERQCSVSLQRSPRDFSPAHY